MVGGDVLLPVSRHFLALRLVFLALRSASEGLGVRGLAPGFWRWRARTAAGTRPGSPVLATRFTGRTGARSAAIGTAFFLSSSDEGVIRLGVCVLMPVFKARVLHWLVAFVLRDNESKLMKTEVHSIAQPTWKTPLGTSKRMHSDQRKNASLSS